MAKFKNTEMSTYLKVRITKEDFVRGPASIERLGENQRRKYETFIDNVEYVIESFEFEEKKEQKQKAMLESETIRKCSLPIENKNLIRVIENLQIELRFYHPIPTYSLVPFGDAGLAKVLKQKARGKFLHQMQLLNNKIGKEFDDRNVKELLEKSDQNYKENVSAGLEYALKEYVEELNAFGARVFSTEKQNVRNSTSNY